MSLVMDWVPKTRVLEVLWRNGLMAGWGFGALLHFSRFFKVSAVVKYWKIIQFMPKRKKMLCSTCHNRVKSIFWLIRGTRKFDCRYLISHSLALRIRKIVQWQEIWNQLFYPFLFLGILHMIYWSEKINWLISNENR